jgi:tocopherol O-methyltransferase
MQTGFSYKEEIITYYDTCWLERFKTGHNPKSLAMHMGYFEQAIDDNDDAKNAMNRFVAETLGLDAAHDGKVIVDAGCGIGGTCLFLGRRYAGLKITGVNISEQQIKLAQDFIAGHADMKSEIGFLCEDYSQTSIASNSVDMIYGIESVCHAAEKESFYKEAYRILKPGGKLLIIDYVHVVKDEDGHTAGLISAFQKGWTVKEYISNPLILLANAGFAPVQISSITPKVMPGIVKSYNGAVQKISALNGSIPPMVKKHLEACIALKSLSEMGVIDYCVIQCTKPL